MAVAEVSEDFSPKQRFRSDGRFDGKKPINMSNNAGVLLNTAVVDLYDVRNAELLGANGDVPSSASNSVKDSEAIKILSGDYINKEILLKKEDDEDYKIYMLKKLEENVAYFTPSGNRIERFSSQQAVVNGQHFIDLDNEVVPYGSRMDKTVSPRIVMRKDARLSQAQDVANDRHPLALDPRFLSLNANDPMNDSKENLRVLERSVVLSDMDTSQGEDSDSEWLMSPRSRMIRKQSQQRLKFNPSNHSAKNGDGATHAESGTPKQKISADELPSEDNIVSATPDIKKQRSLLQTSILDSPQLASPSTLSHSFLSLSPITSAKNGLELDVSNLTFDSFDRTEQRQEENDIKKNQMPPPPPKDSQHLKKMEKNINNKEEISVRSRAVAQGSRIPESPRQRANTYTPSVKGIRRNMEYVPQLFKPQKELKYQRPRASEKAKKSATTKRPPSSTPRSKTARQIKTEKPIGRTHSVTTFDHSSRQRGTKNLVAKGGSLPRPSTKKRTEMTSSRLISKVNEPTAGNNSSTLFPPTPSPSSSRTFSTTNHSLDGSISGDEFDFDDTSSVLSFSSTYSLQSVESKNWKLLQWRKNNQVRLSEDMETRRTRQEFRRRRQRERIIEATVATTTLFDSILDSVMEQVRHSKHPRIQCDYMAIPIPPHTLVLAPTVDSIAVDCHIYPSQLSEELTVSSINTRVRIGSDALSPSHEESQAITHQQQQQKHMFAYVEVPESLLDSNDMWFELVVNGARQPRQKFIPLRLDRIHMSAVDVNSVPIETRFSRSTPRGKRVMSHKHSEEHDMAGIELSIVTEDDDDDLDGDDNRILDGTDHKSTRSRKMSNASATDSTDKRRKGSIWGQFSPTVAHMAIRQRQLECERQQLIDGNVSQSPNVASTYVSKAEEAEANTTAEQEKPKHKRRGRRLRRHDEKCTLM